MPEQERYSTLCRKSLLIFVSASMLLAIYPQWGHSPIQKDMVLLAISEGRKSRSGEPKALAEVSTSCSDSAPQTAHLQVHRDIVDMMIILSYS